MTLVMYHPERDELVTFDGYIVYADEWIGIANLTGLRARGYVKVGVM